MRSNPLRVLQGTVGPPTGPDEIQQQLHTLEISFPAWDYRMDRTEGGERWTAIKRVPVTVPQAAAGVLPEIVCSSYREISRTVTEQAVLIVRVRSQARDT